MIFLISAQKHRLWILVRTASMSRNMKNISEFLSENIQFLVVKISIYLKRSVFLMISQLIRFARASSNLSDFNCRNKALTAKLLRQGYRYFKLRKAFSKFYRRQSAW